MHPTVEKFQLRTYTSRYDGVTCAICRKEITKGDKIACITPMLGELRTLNMSAKVFKYAHLGCLPLWVEDDRSHEAVKEATAWLWDRTDPEWPKDEVGFDVPGAGLAQSWAASGYSRLGTQRMAKHLTRFHGQLDESLYNQVQKVADLKAPAPKTAQTETAKQPNGWLQRDRPASRSEVFVGVQSGLLVVCINKWENASHEAVYYAVKKLRARWDGSRKCWVLPEGHGLTLDNFENQLAIDRDKTEVACSARAWELLSEAAGEQEAPEPKVKTREIAGVTCEVTERKPDGKILVAANGEGLKIHLDPPWVNPDHARVKDEIKNIGAKWDKVSKTWRLGVSALIANFSVFADQDIAITEDALAMLDNVLGRQRLSNALDASSDEIKEKVAQALPEDLSLYPFQYAGVEFVERAGGRAVISDEMGCVDGNAEVRVNRAKNGFRLKLKDLYYRFHGNQTSGKKWDPAIDTYIRSAHQDQLRLTRVLDVLDKGVRPVLKIELESGTSLRVTPDHKICCDVDQEGNHSYVEAQNLLVGSAVVVNGKSRCPTCGTTENIITHPHAKFRGYCKQCMYRQCRKPGRKAKNGPSKYKGYIYRNVGLRYHPNYNRTMGIAEHRLVYEASLNNISLEEWLEVCRTNSFTDDHVFLDSDLHIHHKNGVITDNRIENLEAVTVTEHVKKHKVYKHFGFSVVKKERVKSISDDGTAHVYDVVCEHPHHNFVANNIVVHNCGKSIQTVGYLALHPEQRPAVLVVPAVVTGNWLRELAKWLPNERTQQLKTGSTKIDPEATIYVLTYDLVKKHLSSLKERKPQMVVGDEVHLCKNPKAARTKAFIELAQLPSVKAMIGLSGTPIVNRPLEFHTFLSLLNPTEFGNWFKYTERYCDGHYDQIYVKGGRGQTKRVWKTGGASNTDELHQRLRSMMIRRRKQDVLTELPDKIYQEVVVEMKPKDRKAYKAAIKADDITLAQITAARQAAGRIKVRHALDWVETHPGTPLLIFAHHQDVLNGLESGLSDLGVRVGRIDGSVAQERRTELVEAFQAGELDVMILSIKAAGVGITLTRAADVLFVEKDWTPGGNRQAEDRAHRIGQANAVTIHSLVLQGTVDADINELLASKQDTLDAVLDGEQGAVNESLSIRQELVERWESKK